MKFGVSVLLTIIVSFAAGLYLPFWSVALVSFCVAAFIYQKPVMAWLTGFVSIFICWGLLAFWIDSLNDSILSTRMASPGLFPLGGSSSLLILITAVVGAIIGGMAALSGSLLRKYLDERKASDY
jgi:hypothetical protein